MLSAKRFGSPQGPILVHAMIHAALIGCVLIPFVSRGEHYLFGLIFIELFTHFGIDVLKGKLNKWFPIFQNNAEWPHWTLFGFDQFAHQLIIILITYLAVL